MKKLIACRPPYVADVGSSRWRVVIPVAGKLSPKVRPEKFSTKAEAQAWLDSAEGSAAVAEDLRAFKRHTLEPTV